MFRLRFATVAAAALFFSVPAFADYAVGTCMLNLVSYGTISEAVSSVPSGSVIFVCPGIYPEQVVITQPLTLEGAPGVTSDAVITVPPGGLTQSVTLEDALGAPVQYQVLVQSAGTVNILNLAVDGTSAVASSEGNYIAGIVYEDSSGKADHLSVRNQQYLFDGVGLLAITLGSESQTVTVENSVFRGFDNVGVWSVGSPMTTNVTSNTINGTASDQSIGVCYCAGTGAAQSNLFSGNFNGVDIYGASSVGVTGNMIAAQPFSFWEPAASVYVQGSYATVQSNIIDSASDYGVYLVGQVTNSIIRHNTIGNSSTAVYGCDNPFVTTPASGYTVNLNTITDALVGIEMASANTTTPNTYYATANALEDCSSANFAARTSRRTRALPRVR